MNTITLLIFIIFLLLVIIYNTQQKKEFFLSDYLKTNEDFKSYLQNAENNSYENFNNETTSQPENVKCSPDSGKVCQTDNWVHKSHIERAVQKAVEGAVDRSCPVPSDYNPDDYIHKSQKILSNSKCPDMKDYVLKSSIPPMQKCAPCICPKVKVNADLCKEVSCTLDKCKSIMECPKCEPVQTNDIKVCPAIKIPKSLADNIEQFQDAPQGFNNNELDFSNLDFVEAEDEVVEEEEDENDMSVNLNNINNNRIVNTNNNRINNNAINNNAINNNAINNNILNSNRDDQDYDAYLNVSPTQSYDSKCSPVNLRSDPDEDGLLGSLYN